MDPAGDFWAEGSGARDAWVAFARDLVRPALAFPSADRSELHLPGRASWHGKRADGLEAFARVFLLEALAGCREPQVAPTTHALLEGIGAGLTSTSGGWIRASENSHALVEAPSLCVALWVADHRLWNELPGQVQDAVVAWLVECADLVDIPGNNWMLFPFVISRFLDSVDRPSARRRAIEDHTSRRLDDLYRGGGWYSDGGPSTFDYYTAFGFHYYPGLVATLSADAELRERSASRLAAFLPDLLSLVARDGAPVYFGRSMTYRFAIAAPLSLAPLLGVVEPAPAQLRAATQRVVDHFVSIGGVTPGSPLAPGWARNDVDLVQDYSGPGAAYWVAHAFTNLLLEPGHAYWNRPAGDAGPVAGIRRLEPPNFLLASPPDRAIVRLTNHGSFDDNVTNVKRVPDDPYYGRVAYSTATVPLTQEEADSCFTVEYRGRRYRRARIAGQGGGADWASSLGWLRDIGGAGEARAPATFVSLSTPSWDVHILALPRWARRRRATVTFRGWAVDDSDGSGQGTTAGVAVEIRANLRTAVHGLTGFAAARVVRATRPRGSCLLGELTGHDPGGLYAVATSLSLAATPDSSPPAVERVGRDRWLVRIPGSSDRVIRRRRGRVALTPAARGRDE